MPDLPSDQSYRPVVAALAESEDRFRTLVEGVRRYAIFMLDPKGIILTWNRGIEELLGYNRDDIVGQPGTIVFNVVDRAAGVFRRELARAKRTGESLLEHSNTRRDGTEIAVHDTTTALFRSDGVLLGFAKVTRRLDEPANGAAHTTALDLAKALAAIQVEVDHRRRLEVQLLTAVEEERERIGRDLHDDISQHLAGIALMLGSIAKDVEKSDAPAGAKLRNVASSLSHAVDLARNLARGLHPVTLTNDGLPAALRELAERVPLDIEFKWPKSARLDFDSAVALHVYRMAEEAVGNAVRHSGASKISIAIEMKPKRHVALTITDNGRGFLPTEAADGMGLQNMKYRAGAIAGILQIISNAGTGTCVKCTLPLRALRRRAAPPKRKKPAN